MEEFTRRTDDLPAREAQPVTSWAGFRTTDGSKLIFSPPGLRTRKRPCVTIGRFRRGRGDIAIHFRIYHEQAPGVLAISRDGISLSLAELDIIEERVARIVGADTTEAR
ncbi:MAG: hypothetical protein WEA80_13055 [Gemmatimonadaceae bacterium]